MAVSLNCTVVVLLEKVLPIVDANRVRSCTNVPKQNKRLGRAVELPRRLEIVGKVLDRIRVDFVMEDNAQLVEFVQRVVLGQALSCRLRKHRVFKCEFVLVFCEHDRLDDIVNALPVMK